MLRSLTTAASGMVAQQTNLDVISNNLANVNTTGYKTQRAEFQDLMYNTLRGSGSGTGPNSNQPTSVQIGLGVKFSSVLNSFAQGPMQSTGNPTDLAINGDGFFRVTAPDGKLSYTRDGSLKQDVNGNLVTSDGYLLADDINVPVGTTALSISADGTVSGVPAGENTPKAFGKIQLATFINPGGLMRMGNNLFRPSGASGDAVDVTPGTQGAGSIQPGFIEGSNVQVVDEMVRMISAQRAYEINSKAVTTADDMLSTLNQLKR